MDEERGGRRKRREERGEPRKSVTDCCTTYYGSHHTNTILNTENVFEEIDGNAVGEDGSLLRFLLYFPSVVGVYCRDAHCIYMHSVTAVREYHKKKIFNEKRRKTAVCLCYRNIEQAISISHIHCAPVAPRPARQHMRCSGGRQGTPSSSKIRLSSRPSSRRPSASFFRCSPRSTSA